MSDRLSQSNQYLAQIKEFDKRVSLLEKKVELMSKLYQVAHVGEMQESYSIRSFGEWQQLEADEGEKDET